MPSKDPKIQKAYKDGVITKGQYDKLSDGLLLGIIKKKGGKAPAKAKDKKKTISRVPDSALNESQTYDRWKVLSGIKKKVI